MHIYRVRVNYCRLFAAIQRAKNRIPSFYISIKYPASYCHIGKHTEITLAIYTLRICRFMLVFVNVVNPD